MVNYLGRPYHHTIQTSYNTGAKKRDAINNAFYERLPGNFGPEQYNAANTNIKRSFKDIYFADTRRYLPGLDSMNPITQATPNSKHSRRLPDTRLAIPATPRRVFNTPFS